MASPKKHCKESESGPCCKPGQTCACSGTAPSPGMILPTLKYKSAFSALAEARHSTRRFTGEPVPRKDIESILAIASRAPSACNKQANRYYIVTKPEDCKKISDEVLAALPEKWQKNMLKRHDTLHVKDPIFCDAPVLIGMAFHPDGMKDWAGIDIGLAAAHIELAAQELGYGTLNVGISSLPEPAAVMKKHMNIPEDQLFCLTVALGKAHPEFVPTIIKYSENVVFL